MFGGDPTNVTLMGHGTGAACVHFLLTSLAVPEGKSTLSLFSSKFLDFEENVSKYIEKKRSFFLLRSLMSEDRGQRRTRADDLVNNSSGGFFFYIIRYDRQNAVTMRC